MCSIAIFLKILREKKRVVDSSSLIFLFVAIETKQLCINDSRGSMIPSVGRWGRGRRRAARLAYSIATPPTVSGACLIS